jgi:Bifunctional DNA primase/polymerase, N-terminal
MPSILETAQQLVGAGVSIISVSVDGSKRPAWDLLPLGDDGHIWKPYQTRLATPNELRYWFEQHNAGVAVVCGQVSGNLEILDIDEPTLVKPWHDAVEAIMPGLASRLVVVKTPREGHGRHIYYRCQAVDGNLKLARDANKHCMIETRGEGGYALHPASPAKCHPTNRRYRLVQGDFTAIPVLTEDERDVLLSVARGFNQHLEPELKPYTPSETPTTGERPGDMFAAKTRWRDVLAPHGWKLVYTRGDVGYWRRPGKRTGGISASTDHHPGMLHVFSSNAYPFEPDHEYSKFTAFALLNADGDFIKAATMLAYQGYVKAHEGRLAGYQGYTGYRGYHGYRGRKGVVSRG